MRRLHALLLLLLLTALGCGTRQPASSGDDGDGKGQPSRGTDPGAAELERLKGDWYVVSLDEKEKRVREARGRVLSFQGGQFTLKDGGGNVRAAGTCKADPSSSPKKIDFVHQKGDFQGKTTEGIYDEQNGFLRLCLAPPGAARPKAVLPREGSYLVLTRNKVEAAPRFDPASQEMGRLRATWVVVETHEKGIPTSAGKGRKLVFFDDQFNLVEPDGKVIDAGTCRLEIEAARKNIDLRHKDGKTVAAIYDLNDDTLKLCLAPPGGERPTEFVSKAAAGTSLLVLKKEEALLRQAELAKLEGTWVAESVEEKGKPVEEARGRQFIFLNDQLSIKDARGKELAFGSCKPIPGSSPAGLDLTYRSDPHKGQVALLIYELEGDTLKICLPAPGAERPTEFASRPGTETSLLVLRRAKR
jgi:uncharacterized protein (TIGR03067 family)